MPDILWPYVKILARVMMEGHLSVTINCKVLLAGGRDRSGCARRNHPGVYTKVCYFIEWIKDEIDKFEDIDNHIVAGFQDDGSLDFWKSNGLNSI